MKPLCAAAVLLLSGCALHFSEGGVHDGERDTSCSVACPGNGRASASCAAPKQPACSCDPSPTASCLDNALSDGVRRGSFPLAV